MVEESTKALEEEWADKAEAASTQEAEEKKAKTEHDRSTESARAGAGGATQMLLSETHKKRRTDTKTKDCVAPTAAVRSVPPDAQPLATAISKQESKLSQKQVQTLEEGGKQIACNPLQLQLYRAMRSYSQLTPADKLKERRYAGLGLGKTTQYGKGKHSVAHVGNGGTPSATLSSERRQQQQQSRDRAAKIQEQCPRCSSSGIEGLPCVCRHALLGANAHSLPPAKSLLSLLPKLPHKRLLVLPRLEPGGEEKERTKGASHNDPRLSGNCSSPFCWPAASWQHLQSLLLLPGDCRQ